MKLRVLVVVLGAAACASRGASTGYFDQTEAPPGLGAGTDASTFAEAGTLAASDASAPSDECSENTKKVYVVTQTKDLYRFDPETGTFTKVGPVACPTTATVYSMAVDRKGRAWVLFADGAIFHVSTETAACSPSGYVPGQQGFVTFGMGFVTDAPGSSTESLYVVDDASRLAQIDTKTLGLRLVGTFSGGRSELSGTSEARLFTLFSDPAAVGEVNRKTGVLLSKKPVAIEIFLGFAFAQWGGDFWLFTALRNPALPAVVVQYSFTTGAIVKTFTGDVGGQSAIVGAGVSTCAPTSPVR